MFQSDGVGGERGLPHLDSVLLKVVKKHFSRAEFRGVSAHVLGSRILYKINQTDL